MRKLVPLVTALMLCNFTLKAQESEMFNNALNSVFPKLNSVDLLKSSRASPTTIFDAYNADKIFVKLIGNEDYNKVMLLMINNTAGSLELYLEEGTTTIRNPCTSSTYYSFYTPDRIDINLGQDDQFILVNQAGSTLIESGSVLFTDISCSYNWLTTVFTSYYDPIPDEILQELFPFNPDTSTLQQVFGDADGDILILRNYNNTGMKSRYIYLDEANEGEIYTEFTADWFDDAFESLTTHDFIVELDDNNEKILKSVEIPTVKITNSGVQGAISNIFTVIVEVREIDEIAPELSAVDNLLYQSEFIEVTSTEDGIIYLVPEDTNKDLTSIRGVCIDSVAALANEAVNLSVSELDVGNYWLYARDATGNISDPEVFTIFMEIDEIAPELSAVDNLLYQSEFIEVTCTEDGIIYLVPEDTNKDLTSIRGVCIDSVAALANEAVNLPVSQLDVGNYWLYARDATGNISDPEVFTIFMEIDEIAPSLYVTEDSLYNQAFIKAISTEDGFIYLVPQYTYRDLTNIRGVCLDSVAAIADDVVSINISGLENGKYWLYARDGSNNISEYQVFTIAGVGIVNILAGQIRIFPIPTNNLITLQAREPGEYSIEIISMNGKIILGRNFIGKIYHIELSSFQKGVYFITIRSKDFVTTEKIIKL